MTLSYANKAKSVTKHTLHTITKVENFQMEWLKAAGTTLGLGIAIGYIVSDVVNNNEKEALR